MAKSGTVVVKITGDARGLKNALDESEGRLSHFGGKVGGFAKTVGLGLAAGTAAAGVFGWKAVGAASDVNEAFSKMDTIFGASSGTIDKWSKGAAENIGLSRGAALDAAGTFGNMFTQLGIGAGKAAEMSTGIVDLAADFASFHNADISEVISAQSAAFRGEYDALQRFLPLINAASVEQKALAMTGKATTKELTAQDKALAVQALMMEGAGKAQGDFARTSDGLANKMRILKARGEDFVATVGAALLPVVLRGIDAFIRLGGEIRERLAPIFARVGAVVRDDVGPAFGRFVGVLRDDIAPIVTRISGFIADNVVPLFERFAALVGDNAVPAFAALGAIVAAVVLPPFVAWAAATVVAVAPVLALLAAVGLLAAGVVYAYEHFVGFREGVEKAKDVVVAAFGAIQAVVETVVAVVSELWTRFGDHILGYLRTALDALGQVVSGVFSVIQGIFDTFAGIFTGDWSRLWEGIKGIFTGLWQVIGGLIDLAINNIATILGAAVAGISAAWSFIWNALKTLFGTLWGGIETAIGGGLDAIVGFFTAMPGRIATAAAGMWDGIKDAFRAAINWIIGKWNDLRLEIGGNTFDLPGPLGSITIPSMALDTPNLPMFHQGGVVPGRAGSEMLGLLQAGERVIPRGAAANAAPTVIQLIVDGKVLTEIVHNGMLEKQRRTGALGLAG